MSRPELKKPLWAKSVKRSAIIQTLNSALQSAGNKAMRLKQDDLVKFCTETIRKLAEIKP